MSVLISLTHEISTPATAVHAIIVPMAGDGILDWLTAKNAEAQVLFR